MVSAAFLVARAAVPATFGSENWFLQSHPAVLLAAWCCGFGPGLLAIALSAAGAAFVFVPPAYSFALTPPQLSLVGTFVAIGVLITAVTDALRRSRETAFVARQKAERAQQRYRRLMDLTPIPVFVVSEGVIAYVNDAMRQLIGAADPDTMTGKSPLVFVHLDSRRAVEERMRTLTAGEQTSVPRLEQVWLREDGSSVVVEATGALVPWNDSDAIQSILRDITEEKRATEEREALLSAAQRANTAKDHFLVTVSHELRTPLNAILGWTHILRKRDITAAETARALAVIERNGKALSVLVEDLLDMSQIARGTMRMATELLDLRDTVVSAVDAMRPAAEAEHVELRVTQAPTALPVIGDPVRLQQVVWNILGNAIKFSAEQGVVTIRVQAEAGMAVLTVSDTGRGMEPEFFSHLFDKFSQEDTSPSRATGGVGIGLAIVRHIVQAHQGSVTGVSEGRGRGSTFTVQLPLAAESASR